MQLDFGQETPKDNEQSIRTLFAMARLGMPRQALAVLLDFALGDKLDKEHRRFLSGPIIQHKSQWKDTTPVWMYEAIGYDRLSVIFKERAERKIGWQLGPIELATMMYPATMESPLRHEYAQIYLWAAAKANAYHYNKSEEEIWTNLGIRRIPDDEILKPQGQYHYAFRELCIDVRRKVVNHATDYERQAHKQQSKPKPPPTIMGSQLELF